MSIDPNLPPIPEHIKIDQRHQHLAETIGHYSVAMMVSKEKVPNNPPLSFQGSGTLVELGNSRYILTAAHVWDSIKKYDQVEFAARPDQFNRIAPLETRNIKAHSLPRQTKEYGQYGPDLCLLKLPASQAGYLAAFKNFHNLDKRTRESSDLRSSVDVRWILSGVPAEWGSFSSNVSKFVHISFVWENDDGVRLFEQDGMDFVDLESKTSGPGSSAPSSFGGVSGGGLWRLEGQSMPKLQGVAFYEFFEKDRQKVRCHGWKSIQKLTETVTS